MAVLRDVPVLIRLSGLILALVGSGCTNERIVFREPINPPPDESSGLLGYFSAEDGQTTCGNCHIGQQSEWRNTAHAGAFATLDADPGAQAFCYSCHTVTERGNSLTAAAGWDVVQDVAYHDVQCESCHGPGLAHAENPDNADNVPLASIKVAIEGENNCGECHSGVHHPFVEEWASSRHAVANPQPAGRAECIACHTAQGAFAAWGVRAAYLEQDAPIGEHEGIVCAVCHDPHGGQSGLEPGSGEGGPGSNIGQLRYRIDVPSQEENLCVKCHHKRAEPETQSATIRGPHSPEGPLLLGEGAGWFPPNFQPEIDRILGTHGSSANPKLCATCHVLAFTVTDAEGTEVRSVGHSFQAIPCVDANGVPTGSDTCTLPEREFAGCTASGCHGTEETARAAYTTAEAIITDLVEQLDVLLARPEVAPDNVQNDGKFTVADGAWFNSQLAKMPGSHVHNPFLIEQLLIATIDQLQDTYAIPSTAITVPMIRRLL
ncbi:MAG TPA: cytochrome c3 family protein [Gemmatimonadales bacterium]|nr:cytochrome c3 family protein [Gemmatimonadales bacterium]